MRSLTLTLLAAGLAAGLVSGCTYWAKPGGTPAQLEAAKARCETESFARFPQTLQTVLISAGYVAPIRTECRATPQGQYCVTVGGEYVPPAYSTVDANSQPRSSAYRSCLLAGGWQPASSRKEAEAITRGGRPAGTLPK